MNNLFIISASFIGALAVITGAFGAHALKEYLIQINRAEVFETAVKYQFYHTFALLVLGIIQYQKNNNILIYSGYSFIIGMFVFSGSLYILCFTNVSKWGAITPIGGLFLIMGWILMGLGIIKK